MDFSSDLSDTSLSFLCFRCAEETDLFFHHKLSDPRFCFEIFRRAIGQKDNQAWECLYLRYGKLVAGWVERHPLSGVVEEDTELLVNQAFEKMWSVINPEKMANFHDLKSILRYLQMCVHSVLTDLARASEKSYRLDEFEEQGERLHPAEPAPGVEEGVMEQSGAAALWTMMKERLKTEKERRIIYGTYILALKPAELCELYPGTFKDVQEVYVVKNNLIERLRRDADLKALFQEIA
jgi:DNA-directed RNA polymerase specialized sigma24 family protein